MGLPRRAQRGELPCAPAKPLGGLGCGPSERRQGRTASRPVAWAAWRAPGVRCGGSLRRAAARPAVRPRVRWRWWRAQLAASSVFLLVIAMARREPFAWTPPVRHLAALGVLNPGIAYALGLVGLTTITASMSVLLWALEPVAIMLLAALVLREHIPPALAAAVAVAIAGVLLVVYQPGATGERLGITLTVVSVGFCALYSVLTRRLLLDDSSLTVVLAQQVAALLFAVILASVVALAGGPGWDLGGHGAGDWAGAAVSGVLYYGAGFWFFITALRQVSASVAGSFLPLIPVFGLAAGYLVGERLEPRQWFGAVVIVAATAVFAIRTRAARPAASAARVGAATPRLP